MIDGKVTQVLYVQSRGSGHGIVSWTVQGSNGSMEHHHAVLDQLKVVVAQAEAQRLGERAVVLA